MKRLLLLSTLIVSACGRADSPASQHTDAPQVVTQESDYFDVDRHRESREQLAIESTRLADEAQNADLVIEYGKAVRKIVAEGKSKFADDPFAETKWMVDLYKGRSVQEVIALVDSWD